MAENFDTINKQIASFIMVSVAVSMPAFVETPSSSVYADGVLQTTDMMVRYAGPVMPTPIPNEPSVVRYAGPVMPTDQADVKINSAETNINNPGINNIQNTNYGMTKIKSGHYIFK